MAKGPQINFVSVVSFIPDTCKMSGCGQLQLSESELRI